MKKITVLSLIYFIIVFDCYSQRITDDIQVTLDNLKNETRQSLINKRLDSNSSELHINPIQWALPDNQFETVEKLGLKLNLGMIYDEDMRNRLLQLLKNEYNPDEIDTLVNRLVYMSIGGDKRKVLEITKLDTITKFKRTVDSLCFVDKVTNPNNILYPYQYANIAASILGLDTLDIYKRKLDSLLKEARKEACMDLLNDRYIDLSSIAELCGYVNDKRFIKPLIEALDKHDNFRRNIVIEALARMKVEPYHSNLLKEYTLPIDKIISGYGYNYFVFIDVLRSQESFLELSKYLKSNVPCMIVADDESSFHHGDELKFCVMRAIYNNLENKDLKKLIGDGSKKLYMPYDITPEWDAKLDILYDWMQKNYGKYEFTWYYYYNY